MKLDTATGNIMARALFPHQIAGADFLETESGVLLAADPGLGKTFTSITALERMGARRVLVVCPAILTTNWMREFSLAESSLTPVDARKSRTRINSGALIVSVDWMRYKEAQALTHGTWDAVIVDEAHTLANPDTKRTQAVYTNDIQTEKMILLTGTPASKHAGQLWPHINRTAPDRIDNMSYEQFTARYCVTEMRKFGGMRYAQPYISGNQRLMIPELRERLSGWWLRQKKQDVLTDLPDKLVTVVNLQMKQADLRALQDEIDPDLYEHIMFAAETGDVSALSSMSDMVTTLRRLLAKTKVKPAVEYIAGMVTLHESPVSVWGWHTEALRMTAAALEDKGLRVGLITGQTSQRERDRIVDAFQDGRLDVFLGQIKAAGVGITLTRGYRAIFMEESFSPDLNVQAADRHHRIGQKNTVMIDRLILMDSIDEAVAAIAAKRQAQWEELEQGAKA